ncbi:MAG TPA: RagB/SusD family nutrient uptake outer membrane protein [Chitinophagaceae bacterium]|nr:RagB/SusD family nutrient uptake outer membrane protein [Chitinophagaceae bacterium]
MKKIIIALVVISMAGCSKVLDIQPLDMIAETAVFSDKNLIEANLLSLYDRTKFQELGNQENFRMGLLAGPGGECRAFGDWQDPYIASIKIYDNTGSGLLDYWAYTAIRQINEFIDGVNGSSFEQSYKDQKVSEARFLRAFIYHQMVKRFGGVPIITKVLKLTDPQSELYPARNKEAEVYDFIGREMDDIAQILPASYPASSMGRPTRFAALALKSRAMLYAGSIARFGTVELDGIVGIPASEANRYFTAAMTASKQIMDNSLFSLYNKVPTDPVRNFTQLFTDENNNPEVIFSVRWDATLNKGHSWDALCTPAGFTSGWNSNFNVFVEFADLFDFQDGRSGVINRALLTNTRLHDIDSLFGRRDPRFRASVFYPECIWQGKKVFFHSSTRYRNASGQVVTNSSETFMIPNSISTQFPDGFYAKAPNRNTQRTGMHLRKRCDESLAQAVSGQSSTDFIVFRLGEILLNYAEAAFYLNQQSEALSAINAIRTRARMPLRTSVTEANIRQERQVELAFEEHRYWDLRRWRIAEQELNGKRLQGLNYVYDYDARRYIITLKNAEGAVRVFQRRHYYLPLGINRIADNPSLVENPGY